MTPFDWPGPGPIDLALHDRPHRSSTTEWWYLNAHVEDGNGRAYSLFAAFFALAIGRDEQSGEHRYAYSVEWALVDVAQQRYLCDSLLDRSAPEVGIRRIDDGEGVKDRLFARATREMLAKGALPLPDRMLERAPQVAWDRLALDFDGNRLQKREDGQYELVLQRSDGSTGCALVFAPEKPVVRHGRDGVVRGAAAEHMFYYFTPACAVRGELIVDGERKHVHGRGWYDHEFGGQDAARAGQGLSDVAWNWVALQLDDGWELSLYQLYDAHSGERLPESGVIAIAADGSAQRIEDYKLTPLADWKSTRTFNSYPTRWALEVPALKLALTLEAEFGAQEFVTLISPPAFWEGRVRACGTRGENVLGGLGFIERSGFSNVDTIDAFFAAVGAETRVAVGALLGTGDLARLTGAPDGTHWAEGADLAQLNRTMASPIREIVERGGKTWRSYGLLACIDAVGGDSQAFRSWLALPELVHVGSLIVDDVQDRSARRRGGPSAHTVHGEPLAINAGCVAYFLAELAMRAVSLSDAQRVQVYQWYFAAMRAAHMGQALDLDGLEALVPSVLLSGDIAALERRLFATHTLKSGAAPSALARVAVVLGNGQELQGKALGGLFEAFGLAFQIMDDVLNLRGFAGELKTRGEDIADGKVTAPVVKALARLGREQRERLWQIISARSKEVTSIAEAIELITKCGALDACETEARAIIEAAWAQVDPVLPDSFAKSRLRAFGWFVLERHY